MTVGFPALFRIVLWLPALMWVLFKLTPIPFLLTLGFAFEIVKVPYILFGLVCTWISFKVTEKRLKRFSLFLPLAFIPFSTVGFVIWGEKYDDLANEALTALLVSAIYVPLYGYAYVLLGWFIYMAINKVGSIRAGGT